MNITIASKLMELYAACPKCGCEVIGNGKGLLECDTAAGFFDDQRSGGKVPGWHVEVTEVITEGSMPEAPPELPTEDEDEPEPVAFANPEPEPAPKPISEPEPVLEPEKIRPWNGFVHIRCEACHKESTTCLRTPTDTYICKECGHEMPLPKAYRAYTRCECGQKGAYCAVSGRGRAWAESRPAITGKVSVTGVCRYHGETALRQGLERVSAKKDLQPGKGAIAKRTSFSTRIKNKKYKEDL